MSTSEPPRRDDRGAAAGGSTPQAVGAGRGVIYIAFAKFYFMFAGLVIQFRLPSMLTRAAWGSYSVVNAITSFVNNVLITGTIQTVSRFSAQDPEQARRVQLAGLRMHLRLGLVVAVLFIAAAPIVAWRLDGSFDSEKTAPLMLAGLIIAGNAFYAVFIGTANGLRQFHKQAGLDITNATSRVIGMLGMAFVGLGVFGIFAGWVVAVGIVFCAAVVWVGLPGRSDPADRIAVRPLLSFFARVAVFLTLFNATMFVDGILIKLTTREYFTQHAAQLGSSLDQVIPWAAKLSGYRPDPSELADVQTGYYAAVQNLARLSYQAIIAVTFVVFPLVSRSTFTEDRETTKSYIQVTVRYSLIFALAIAVVMAANPVDILGVIYAPDFAHLGGPALPWLALGNVAFSILAINSTILNSAGATRSTIVAAAVTIGLAAIGNYIAIPLAIEANRTLEVAAAVTGGAMIVGALATGLVMRRRFEAFLPLLSAIRIGAASAVAIAVGRMLPLHGKLMSLVEAGIVAATFAAGLILTRELGAKDLEAIKAVRRKRAGNEGAV
ncbi:MAG: oligosaccharide flippase family protein [Kofleriaceae bacterium]